MTLRETTRMILKLVEEHSGYPVEVVEDPTLSVFARMRPARRGSLPAHTLTYRPMGRQAPDYAIAYQCGFALRLFGMPADERVDFSGSAEGHKQVRTALEKALGHQRVQLSRPELEQTSQQLYDGLMTHLRSVPIGLRIAHWIRESFPEMHALQRASVQEELKENREAGRSARNPLLPEAVVKPTLAINAAFAQYWARAFGEADLAAGYTSGPAARQGERLLALWDELPKGPDSDPKLVDAWADVLGLAGWYSWTPYLAP